MPIASLAPSLILHGQSVILAGVLHGVMVHFLKSFDGSIRIRTMNRPSSPQCVNESRCDSGPIPVSANNPNVHLGSVQKPSRPLWKSTDQQKSSSSPKWWLCCSTCHIALWAVPPVKLQVQIPQQKQWWTGLPRTQPPMGSTRSSCSVVSFLTHRLQPKLSANQPTQMSVDMGN